jgi:carbon-monoxide dehydrogenase medium subunit
VKPAPFDYVAARSVAEAVELLAGGEDARVLAGGQSLVPLLNMRLARPSLLVDVNRVDGLDFVHADGVLRLGATARQANVLASRTVQETAPLLVEALAHVGHVATRSRGTIGGSLAHADPASELPAVALALDGSVTAAGSTGERTISAADYVAGPFTTTLVPGELLTSVVVPCQAGRPFGFAEISRRHGDFALAGAVVCLEPGRVVVFGVEGRPTRRRDAEQALDGDADPAEVAELATRELDAVSDVHGDADYRRRVTAVLVRRAVEQARRGPRG